MPDHRSTPTPAGHPPAQSPCTAATKKNRIAWRRAVGWLRRWYARASTVLARAERHIMENFRQPPHGG